MKTAARVRIDHNKDDHLYYAVVENAPSIPPQIGHSTRWGARQAAHSALTQAGYRPLSGQPFCDDLEDFEPNFNNERLAALQRNRGHRGQRK